MRTAIPYPIDTLFMYMANMAWNSAMNTAETIAHADRQGPGDRRVPIPHIIYSDAYYSETVAYADLVLPDTTYLERWDCISLLDRPIGGADGPADAIRQPVVTPDRDVRPFQDVLIELGARLGLPGFVNAEGAPRYPGGYEDYIVNHERAPGHRAARRLARRGRRQRRARARRTRSSSSATSRMAASGNTSCRRSSSTSSTPTRPISKTATAMGLIDDAEPIVLQLYVEPLQQFRLAARGPRRGAAAGDAPRAHRDLFRSAAVLVPAVRGGARSTAALSRCTRSPSGRCRCTIPGTRRMPGCARSSASNRLFMQPRAPARALGLADDDWVWVVEPCTAASSARSS